MPPFVILDTDTLLPEAWRPAANGPVHAFNPSLADTPDGLVLAYRICLPDGSRRIATCRLADDLTVVPGTATPFSDQVRGLLPTVAPWFADPRFVKRGAAWWVYWNSGAEVPRNRQYMVALDPASLAPIGAVRQILLDGPHRPVEKNWGFFGEDGGSCIYAADPLRVLAVAREDGASLVLADAGADDPAGPPAAGFRGGASPVRVGDRLFLFGHRLHPAARGTDYRADLIAVSASAPHRVLARHRAGLALPNPFGAHAALPRLNRAVSDVVYPCGAVLRGADWLIGYGINDERCAIARLSHVDVEAGMEAVASPPARPPTARAAVETTSPPGLPAGWLDDPFWVEAARWVHRLAPLYRAVLAPDVFAGLAANCLPIDFSHVQDPADVAIVLPKDDVDRLPLAWLRAIRQFQVIHVDEVFAVLARTARVPDAPPTVRRRHVPYLYKRADRVVAGKPVRASEIDGLMSDRRGGGDYGLMVAAVRTGNAGDALMADAALSLLHRTVPGLDWIVTGGDVDRTLVAGARAVVLGPGGFLYDVFDGRADLHNVGLYGKVAFLAGEYGRPFVGLGLGRQTLATAPGQDFLVAALRRARLLSVRDPGTAASLASLGIQQGIVTTADLSLLAGDAVRAAAAEPRGSTPVVAVAGAFDRLAGAGAALVPALVRLAKERTVAIRIVLQAHEDADWFTRAAPGLQAAIPGLEVVDVRETVPAAFIRAIATADGVVTTRFHTTMLARLAGLPGLVLGRTGDKLDRALDDLPPDVGTVFLGADAIADHDLAAALHRLAAAAATRTRRPLWDLPGAARLAASFDQLERALGALRLTGDGGATLPAAG